MREFDSHDLKFGMRWMLQPEQQQPGIPQQRRFLGADDCAEALGAAFPLPELLPPLLACPWLFAKRTCCEQSRRQDHSQALGESRAGDDVQE